MAKPRVLVTIPGFCVSPEEVISNTVELRSRNPSATPNKPRKLVFQLRNRVSFIILGEIT